VRFGKQKEERGKVPYFFGCWNEEKGRERGGEKNMRKDGWWKKEKKRGKEHFPTPWGVRATKMPSRNS